MADGITRRAAIAAASILAARRAAAAPTDPRAGNLPDNLVTPSPA